MLAYVQIKFTVSYLPWNFVLVDNIYYQTSVIVHYVLKKYSYIYTLDI